MYDCSADGALLGEDARTIQMELNLTSIRADARPGPCQATRNEQEHEITNCGEWLAADLSGI